MDFFDENNNFIDAKNLNKVKGFTSVVAREIGFISEAISKKIKDEDLCSCVVTIDNDTPMTFNGVIEDVIILNGGTGYFPVLPKLEVTGPGSNAELELVVDQGVVQEVVVINGGSGYDSSSEVIVTETEGAGAEFDITLSGSSIQSVQVISGGSDYWPLYPTIEIIDSSGSNGELLISINLDDGSLSDVIIEDHGFNYTNNTSINVIASQYSSGSGANLTPVISSNPISGLDPSIYYEAISDSTCSATKEIKQVLSHFKSLGYKITVSQNTKTKSSIIWKVYL